MDEAVAGLDLNNAVFAQKPAIAIVTIGASATCNHDIRIHAQSL